MVLTIVISTVFNSNTNRDCSKLYYTKISEESLVQKVKRAQFWLYAISVSCLLLSFVLYSTSNSPSTLLPLKKSKHIQTEHHAVVSNDDF